MTRITPEDAKLQLDEGNCTILDIRELWEFSICNLGGLHIPMHEVPSRAKDWKEGQSVLVICKTGKRAEAVANLLSIEFPSTHFLVLEGGITAWYAAYEPTFEMY